MKKLIFLLFALLPCFLSAQKAKIEFTSTSHNFGTISENGGKAIHTFTFKNTGKAPLILTNVRAGCGCTTPEWSRQPVAPGASGNIKVSFDPRNRPGSFIKSITVNSNAENAVVSLTIRGKVTKKPVGPYDAYKYSWGTIKSKNNTLNLGNIKNTQKINRTIEIINSGDQPARIQAPSLPPYLTFAAQPEELTKGQKGTITIQYDANLRNEWGFTSDKIAIAVNEETAGEIILTANIQEDFSQYNGNFETAPAITFSENDIELENLPKNSLQNYDFFITNTGKSELLIRKIKCSDEKTKVHLSKQTIKPGKKIKATVSFQTNNNQQINKIIQFTTNDPRNPISTLKINGHTK